MPTRTQTVPALPAFIEPMLAAPSRPFESDAHAYELKWDGFRSLAFVTADGVRLVGRRRTDFTARFPELNVLAKLPRGTVLDGEIVQLVDGRPDFAAMLGRERSWSARPASNRKGEGRTGDVARFPPVTFVAFDALYVGGRSIMAAPLSDRRNRLASVTSKNLGPRFALSESSTGNGLALFAEVCRRDLEGVVAKRLDGAYEPGERSGSWTKFKRRQSVACVILGYEPSAANGIKSLILASDIGGELRFVGQVGSGIDDSAGSALLRRFRGEDVATPLVPVAITRGRARWLRPSHLCRVSFAEWTAGGRLRQPVFESLIESDFQPVLARAASK